MAHEVMTVTPETSARDIAKLFFDKNIKRVPVVKDDKIIGLVSRADLIRAMQQELEKP